MKQLTIGAGVATSGALRIAPPAGGRNTRQVTLKINDADSWDTANVGVQASYDGTNFFDIESAGTIIGAAPTATRWDTFTVPVFQYYRLRSYNSGTGADVNQTNAITFDVQVD